MTVLKYAAAALLLAAPLGAQEALCPYTSTATDGIVYSVVMDGDTIDHYRRHDLATLAAAHIETEDPTRTVRVVPGEYRVECPEDWTPPGDTATAPEPEPEPAPEGVIFSDGFESGDFSHTENDWHWNAILGSQWLVTTEKPRTGTYSAKLVMTSGKTGENFLDVHAQGSDTLKQAWVEYYLWIPSDYYHLDSGTSNNNKFFQGWSGKRSGDKTYMNFETLRETDGDSGGWWLGIPGGDCTGSEHSGGGTFAIDDNHRGTWVHFQWYMENGTTDGDCSDSGLSVGHVKGWINGTLFSEVTDLHFVYDTSTDPPGDAKDGVDRFRIFGAQNSGGLSQDGEAVFYLDDFKIYSTDPGWGPENTEAPDGE